MSDFYTKVVKKFDFNQDGFLDRVTAVCHQSAGGKEVCNNYQVEMGLNNGGFVSVYDKEGLKKKTEFPKEGVSVFYTPEYYAKYNSELSKKTPPPGMPLLLKARQGRPPSPLLTTKQLIKECYQRISEEETKERMLCFREAVQDPAMHIYQPENEDPRLAYFINDSNEKAVGSPFPLSLLVTDEAIKPDLFVPPELGQQLNENLFAAVRSRSSQKLDEYLYALERKKITEEFLAETVLIHWDRFALQLFQSELAQKKVLWACRVEPELKAKFREKFSALLSAGSNLPHEALVFLFDLDPDETGKLYLRLLRKNPDLVFRQRILDVLAEKAPSHLEPIQYVKALQDLRLQILVSIQPPKDDITEKQRTENIKKLVARAESYIAALKQFPNLAPETLIALYDLMLMDRGKELVNFLKERLQNPKTLRPMVAYLIQQNGAKTDPNWMERYKGIVESVRNLLIMTSDPQDIPESQDLLLLAKRFPPLTSGVLAAAAQRGDSHQEMVPLLNQFAKGATSEDNQKIIAFVAPRLAGSEATRYLLPLTKNLSEKLRLLAYQSLASLGLIDQQVVQAFKEGLKDRSIKVQVFTAHTLMEEKIAESALFLYPNLKNYVESPKYPIGYPTLRMRYPFSSPEKIVTAMKFSEEVFIEQPAGEDGNPITIKTSLKKLTLNALAEFGGPADTVPLLAKLLMEEQTEDDLNLTAHTLVRLTGFKAIPLLMDRLRQPAPDSFYLNTIALFGGMAKSIRNAKPKEKREEAYAEKSAIIKKAAPKIYQLVVHQSLEVRMEALLSLLSLDKNLIRNALIRDSHDPEPMHRARVAEAFGMLHDFQTAQRLIEMTKDSDPSVRVQVYKSLATMKHSKNAAVRNLVRKVAKSDSNLQHKLGNIVAVSE